MTHCTYPNCNCPFDAPADPNWCARGLPKAEASAGCGEKVMIKFLEVKRAYYADPENVVAQWRYAGDTNWMDVIGEPCWDADQEYRIRPRTIRIGAIDVPEPVREGDVVAGDVLYLASCADGANSLTVKFVFKPHDGYHNMWVSRGLSHREKDSAEQHAKALIIVSGGKV